MNLYQNTLPFCVKQRNTVTTARGDSLSKMLRDRLVCGITNRTVQKRLLAEKDLTLEKASP